MAGEKVCQSIGWPVLWLTCQPYVTDLDFELAALPTETIRFLSEAMPVTATEEGSTQDGKRYNCEWLPVMHSGNQLTRLQSKHILSRHSQTDDALSSPA
jgi:hypothetical protein